MTDVAPEIAELEDKSLLLMDDDAPLRTRLGRALESRGFAYLVVEQGGDGTNHGSPWAYDTHVPLLWFGPGIAPGTYPDPATVADLAPTLSALLVIDPPAGSLGWVLGEMLLPGGLNKLGDALTDPDAHRR